jgi:hypothetical protein
MEPLSPEMERIFKAKAERRRQLAALSWPEKVDILLRLQEMAWPLEKDRNPRARRWRLPSP